MSETITLSRAEHQALLDRIEELEDLIAIDRAKANLEAGTDEFVPMEMVDRLIAGESPIKVWREHRGMKAIELAEAADLPRAYLSQLENGVRAGSVDTLRRIAKVLRVTIDDLVPMDSEP
jgi:DNA-binding XRE family transcriptional regulator